MNRQFQLIFCGKQAIDGDTAQVGPQIAEELGMAQATYACEFSVDQASQKAIVKREHENGYEVIEAPLPLLVTTTAELNEPRQPGLWSSIYANDILLIILPCGICLILMKAALALPVPHTGAQGIPTTASWQGRNAFIHRRRGQKGARIGIPHQA